MKLLYDPAANRIPFLALQMAASDFGGASLEFAGPSQGHRLFRFLQTGQNLLGDAGPLVSREAQNLAKEFVCRHELNLAPAEAWVCQAQSEQGRKAASGSRIGWHAG
jgi:hypothetical protein